MKLLRVGMMAAVLVLTFAPVRGDTIDQKLKTMIVSVDFNNATIDQALAALTVMSKQLDYEHRGVQFVIEPEVPGLAKPITLKLENVPLGETLRYVCELGGVGYKADDRLIGIFSLSRVGGRGSDLIKRTFHVEPSFVEAVSSAGVIPSAQTP